MWGKEKNEKRGANIIRQVERKVRNGKTQVDQLTSFGRGGGR